MAGLDELFGELTGKDLLKKGKRGYEAIGANQTYRKAQIDALRGIGDIVTDAGKDPISAAAEERARYGVLQEISNNDELIRNSNQARGMSGGGNELANMLSQRNNANQDLIAKTGGTEGDAITRKLSGLKTYGDTATNIRSQGFNEQATKLAGLQGIDQKLLELKRKALQMGIGAVEKGAQGYMATSGGPSGDPSGGDMAPTYNERTYSQYTDQDMAEANSLAPTGGRGGDYGLYNEAGDEWGYPYSRT